MSRQGACFMKDYNNKMLTINICIKNKMHFMQLELKIEDILGKTQFEKLINTIKGNNYIYI